MSDDRPVRHVAENARHVASARQDVTPLRPADRYLDFGPASAPATSADPSSAPPPLDLRLERPLVDPQADPVKQGLRLAQARRDNGFRTASEAARRLAIAPPTYLAHENGTRQIRPDIAQFYAKKYGVSAQWLLYGAEPRHLQAPSHEDPSGSAPRSAFAATPRGGAGAAQFLQALNAKRCRDGSYEVDEPLSVILPQARLLDGHIPEIDTAVADTEDCWIEFGGADATRSFALRDYLRIPVDMIERKRLYAARLPSNSLFPDMPGGQRVLVDPDDRDIGHDGFFMAAPSNAPSGLLVPVLVCRDARRTSQLFWSRHRPSCPAEQSGMTVFGRIVMRITDVSDEYTQRVAQALLGEPD